MRAPTKEEMERTLEIRHTAKVQEKIRKASVAVCGLGGLGSHVAVALARCGVGHLHLLDFDCVELSNLHRQQYGLSHLGMSKAEALCQELLEINPYLHIRAEQVRLCEDNIPTLLRADEIICEALDVPEAKAMLTNTVLTAFPEKYLVGASGMAGFGNSNAIRTRRVMSHYYLCGDEVSGVEQLGSLTAPRVMLCAAHQANKILEIIIKGA